MSDYSGAYKGDKYYEDLEKERLFAAKDAIKENEAMAGILKKILDRADYAQVYSDGEFELSARTYLTDAEKELVKKYT